MCEITGITKALSRITRIALVCFAVVVCACIVSCDEGKKGGSEPTGAAFDPPSTVAMPTVPSDCAPVETAFASNGYVIAHSSSATKLKFQVAKDEMVYNYDLPNDDTPTVFPVNMGDGHYVMRIMKNTQGNDYVEIDREEADIVLESEYAPFLIPNQFCDYDEGSACVALARKLTADASNQGDAVRCICDYVTENVSYDTEKAKSLSTMTGYVPSPDGTLASGTGVCFDYASLGAAMLRSLGFPTKIITGYVTPGDLYHAWIMVYVNGSWQTGEFSVSPDTWSRVDLTFAASGSTEFTGDGTSYTERYVY